MEINNSALMSLEVVQKKLQKMSSEEASKYKLDNCLGGTSEHINRKAVERYN
jgi:histone deacetylase complex regulatory component SIN3